MKGMRRSVESGAKATAWPGTTGDRTAAPLVIVGLAAAVACAGEGPASSRSSVTLVVERLGASSDAMAGHSTRTFIRSDVVAGGMVAPDAVQVTLRLVPKDPGTATGPVAPSGAHIATVDRYRVRYVRSDGLDTPGIDVPHAWDGALGLTASLAAETVEIVLVRASAKLDPPLVTLREGGGDVVINALAYVTFYGRDHGGARVEAVGAIGIEFGDWSDAESTRG
ncbi:MAG: hypothetical protein OXG04_22270 [Acidobacteria bacterium]|nr:hypothetical protein [Acidobacteriota bacterium]